MGKFRVGHSRAEKQIGKDPFKELLELAAFIEGRKVYAEELEFRYAPSIVTRSEAELLGISQPRFALRALLPGGGVINARRLAKFAESVGDWSSQQTHPNWNHLKKIKIRPFPDFPETPKDVVDGSSCIADSLLQAPKKLRKEYRILEVDLGWCYGESRSIPGTPFMKHVKLSGLCAQAVCLMAGSLLHDHPVEDNPDNRPAIHGVAEVSAVVAEEDCNEMVLSGLRSTEIVKYMRAVGRSAYNEKRANYKRKGFGVNESFETCLSAYIGSGIPVILPVNLTRLGELVKDQYTSLIDQAEVKRGKKANASEPQEPEVRIDHAVLLVGVNGDGSKVLVSDPARRPFLQVASSRLLWATENVELDPVDPLKVASWQHGKTKHVEPASNPEHFDPDRTKCGSTIPVLPHRVKLNLETRQEGLDEARMPDRTDPREQLSVMERQLTEEQHTRAGLLDLAFRLDHADTGIKYLMHAVGEVFVGWNPGSFLLLQAGDVNDSAMIPDECKEGIMDLMFATRDPEHWFWLQFLPSQPMPPSQAGRTRAPSPNEIRVWDAEVACEYKPAIVRELKKSSIKAKYLRGIATKQGDTWSCEQFSKPKAPHPQRKNRGLACPPEIQKPVMKAAMISSVNLNGIESMASWWPKGLPVEIYTFMHQDRAFNDACPPLDERESVVDRMARVAKDPGKCSKAIAHLAERLIRVTSKTESSIAGLASFVPEVVPAPSGEQIGAVSPPPGGAPPELSAGERAIKFLIRLAAAIHAKQNGGPAINIELVGGSRVGGAWPALIDRGTNQQKQDLVYILNRYMRGQATEQLTRSIRRILTDVGPLPKDNPWVCSIELEPGGNFTISTKDDLETFFSRFPESDPLSRFIGINLDISHWILAGKKPTDLADWKYINRLTHVHISDVGQAHFGDAPVGELSDWRPLLPGSRAPLDRAHPCFKKYEPWFNLVAHACAQKKGENLPPYSGYVSVELEACDSDTQATQSVGAVSRLLKLW